MSSSKVSPIDDEERKGSPLDHPHPLASYELKCPPGGEERVVLYSTSLRGIRQTFESCNNVRMILESFNVHVDERDVSMHAGFREELKALIGKPIVSVPRVFINGYYIGGAEEVIELHEDGLLLHLVETLPVQTSRQICDCCGGIRFVPCTECSGSCKILTHSTNKVTRCPYCNENGLIRCTLCFWKTNSCLDTSSVHFLSRKQKTIISDQVFVQCVVFFFTKMFFRWLMLIPKFEIWITNLNQNV